MVVRSFPVNRMVLFSVALFLLPGLCLTISCNVSRQHDNSVRYQLSQPYGDTCTVSCELDDGTVIAKDHEIAEHLVQSCNNQAIVLKECHRYLLFQMTCSGVLERVECQVNCSRLQSPDHTPQKSSSPPQFRLSMLHILCMLYVTAYLLGIC